MDENVNVTPEIRQKAVDFLNSDTRSTAAGIAILEEANYKPHVTAIFKDKIGRKDIPAKVVGEVRLLLRYHANPDAEIHKDDVNAGTINTGNYDDDTIMSISVLDGSEEYPEHIKKLIECLSSLYKERALIHSELKSIGDGADDESNEKRALCVKKIENISKFIASVGEFFTKFKAAEEFDSNELNVLLNTPLDQIMNGVGSNDEGGKEDAEFVLAVGIDALKKQLTNWRGKVTKAKNQLLYQTDKKQDKENPMPACPKRIKIENRLARLEPEVVLIETAIAKLS